MAPKRRRMLTIKYAVKEILVASKPILSLVRVLVRTPLIEKKIGVQTPNKAGIQVAIVGSTTATYSASSSDFKTTPERLMTIVQMTILTVPITW
jgi:hypothetical protein